jgi:prepilin-type N-terminal cleavage/methylation domain-containing protein
MLKNLIKEEGGFTLVELLVTIAILAVLFGVVTLSLSGIGSDAEETVNDAELGVVQSAMDIAMAEYNQSTVSTPSACGVIDGSTTLFTDADDGDITLGDFLRLQSGSTKCVYDWGSDGNVVQGADCSGTCPTP